MPAIHIEHVDFAYTSAVEVFTDLTLHLGEGWTGVVGPNGAGKSTLLSLIAGEVSPESGQVSLDPSGAIVVRCLQEIDDIDHSIEELAVSADGSARKWIGRLDLDPSSLDRWRTLSPGERKRWQIGAALAAEPDILLLDEPTNHLDRQALGQVAEALARFDGAGLVISHDRDFLDGLTTRTLRIDGGGGRLWSGSYSSARETWVAEGLARRESYETAKRQERAIQRRLADERRSAEAKAASFKRRLRTAGTKDHDARSMEAKGRHAGGEAAGAQRLSVTRSELERASSRRQDLAMGSELGGSIFFDYQPSPKRVLFDYSGPLDAGDSRLVEHLDVIVERDDRIRLSGPNGAGKSTLLSTLQTTSGLPAERVLYLPQEITRSAGVRLLDDLQAIESDRRGRILSIVADLGVDPDELLASRRPSPGEARKLALAIGLGVNTWCLLLDEPTNHLDVDAVETVESALAAFPGAIVVVTHDEHFATATTIISWHLDSGVLDVSTMNKTPGSDTE